MFHLNPSSDMEYDTLLATLLDIKIPFSKETFCLRIRKADYRKLGGGSGYSQLDIKYEGGVNPPLDMLSSLISSSLVGGFAPNSLAPLFQVQEAPLELDMLLISSGKLR